MSGPCSIYCARSGHARCRGRRQDGVLVRCQCPCHGEPLPDYDGSRVKMSEELALWIRSHPRMAIYLGRLLHVRPSVVKSWVSRQHHIEPWRINQVKAAIEMGLVPSNGNGRHDAA